MLTGTGADGQTTGPTVVTGRQADTYTDASPTVAEFLVALGQLVAEVAVNAGTPPTAVLVHPRRAAWATTRLDYSPVRWPATPRQVPSITSTAGAGTDQDFALVLVASKLPLLVGAVVFESFDSPGSANLTVRFRSRQYLALLADRRPPTRGDRQTHRRRARGYVALVMGGWF